MITPRPEPDDPDVTIPATVDEDDQDVAEPAAAPALTTDQAAQRDDPVIQPGTS